MKQTVRMLAVAGMTLACLVACQKKDDASAAAGPAEQAGRKLDQAVADIKPELNRLGQKAGEAMQEAGQKLQQKAREGKQDDAGKQ